MLLDEKLFEKNLTRCVICNEPLVDFGNNAEPVKSGQCCDTCNKTIVIPYRIKQMRDAKKADTEKVEERFDDFKVYDRPNGEVEKRDLATKLYDDLTDAGYDVFGRKNGEGYKISKRFEKNLEKAKKICDAADIPYHVKEHDNRYYLLIDLEGINYERVVESLKNDEIDQFFKLAKRMGIETMQDLHRALNEPEAFNKNGQKKKSELNQLKALAKAAGLGHRDYSKHEYARDTSEEPVKEAPMKEDIEIIGNNTIDSTPTIEISAPTASEVESGLVTLVNNLINDENEAINAYESAIVTLEVEGRNDLTDAIREILNDEQKHVGSLQVILDQIKPDTSENIEAGEEEAKEQLPETEATVTIKEVELEDSALQG